MEIDEEQYLAHYGTPRKSGRYPWGSGGTQEERNRTLLGTVEKMRREGMSETEIARAFSTPEHPFTTTKLRALKSIARNAQRQADIGMAQRLKDKGYSTVAIGKRMNKPESTIRSYLEPGAKTEADILEVTANMLKDQVAKKGYLDIGIGVEQHLAISRTKLNTAVARLQEEGYKTWYVNVEQLGTSHQTSIKILAGPDSTYSEVYRNRDQIKQIANFSDNGGLSYDRVLPPLSVSSKRIQVRYAEQGGRDADGVIYVRPGVKDLSLGAAHYAQVRIAVDGTHYLKGMAMHNENLPEGVDLVFNTNKRDTGNKLDAMKEMKNDPENPFGAVVRQIQEHGPNGQKRVTSAMNIVNEEGDWENWTKSLSSQMLSKQSRKLAQAQLGMTYERKKNELDEIKHLDNSAIRKKALELYADDADSSAIHLKAAALPRQGSHVILPINSIKETEVYAPNFHNGERVVLIRYPHGGIFEIPELTVNNRHPEARKLLGNAKDAIGIHSKVAERLSGADFDGDTVLVIPNDRRQVKTAPALADLKGFDPQRAYPSYEGMTRMSPRTKQVEMGKISNLITDMSTKGATSSELARAVRHSMVVIDAEKHNLNYKQSAIENGIDALKRKYQRSPHGGASTLISNSGKTSTTRVPERKLRPAANGGPIDPATGRKVFENTGVVYVNKQGKTVEKTIEVPRLANVDDAHKLSSGTRIEKIYADHSNKLKELANQARLESLRIKPIVYSPKAKVTYANEVLSLEAKLNLSLRNSPLERQAQVIANAVVSQKLKANPEMEASEIKKLKAQELAKARNKTGAKKQQIEISSEEWAAIQAGAITMNKLNQILNHTDLSKVKEMATPKSRLKLDEVKKLRAISMLRNGYTQAEVASTLGVSVTTLKRSLSDG